MEYIKNSVRLMGFAGSDPVIINFASQNRMARVSIAVNEYYKNAAGEAVNQTQWFSLIFWNKKVALVENIIKKGLRFSIEGKLHTQTYTDKKGELRHTMEIVVSSLELLDNDEPELVIISE